MRYHCMRLLRLAGRALCSAEVAGCCCLLGSVTAISHMANHTASARLTPTLSSCWKMLLLTFSSSTTASMMKSACFMPCKCVHTNMGKWIHTYIHGWTHTYKPQSTCQFNPAYTCMHVQPLTTGPAPKQHTSCQHFSSCYFKNHFHDHHTAASTNYPTNSHPVSFLCLCARVPRWPPPL